MPKSHAVKSSCPHLLTTLQIINSGDILTRENYDLIRNMSAIHLLPPYCMCPVHACGSLCSHSFCFRLLLCHIFTSVTSKGASMASFFMAVTDFPSIQVILMILIPLEHSLLLMILIPLKYSALTILVPLQHSIFHDSSSSDIRCTNGFFLLRKTVYC